MRRIRVCMEVSECGSHMVGWGVWGKWQRNGNCFMRRTEPLELPNVHPNTDVSKLQGTLYCERSSMHGEHRLVHRLDMCC